jgi:hypothetical protein
MCATAALCGYSGEVTGPSGVTEVTQWDVTLNVDAQEATSFDSDGWKERIACLKGGSGTFRSIGASSEVGAQTGSFKTNALGLTIAGNIIITKIDVETPVNGIVSFTHSFNFTGAISGGLI